MTGRVHVWNKRIFHVAMGAFGAGILFAMLTGVGRPTKLVDLLQEQVELLGRIVDVQEKKMEQLDAVIAEREGRQES